MAIITIYHVTASIPRSVYEDANGNPRTAYGQAICAASQGSVEAGSDAYGGDNLEEWAQFHTLQEAELCERRFALIAAGETNPFVIRNSP